MVFIDKIFPRFFNHVENMMYHVGRLSESWEVIGKRKNDNFCSDRMDYVKGIPTKLKAFRTFLTMYPEYQGKVVLFQECMPNPDINVLNDRSYKELEESIGQLVGSINGQYGSIAYTPIVYINRSVPAEESAAMYAIADLGMLFFGIF